VKKSKAKQTKDKACPCEHGIGITAWFRLANGGVLLPCSFDASDRHCVLCISCSALLPFGPSFDSPEVLIEIRAAEIVELSKESPLTLVMESEEQSGWRDWPFDYGEPNSEDPGRNAGWLARAILEHFDDSARQRRVEESGQPSRSPGQPTGHEISQSAGLHERLERVSASISASRRPLRPAKVA
jgi:hypothetical protein